jgi:SAM-dependent methyltransferase
MEFTGERFTPECVREIRYEHYHRYAFARSLVQGRRVLDAACGEGYGAALLATAAARVVGVDRSAEAVEHATARYRADNLEFRAADCLELPFADDDFDCVVSFETLEHLAEQDALLAEFRRVLRPDGFLLLSSPDRVVYSERLNNRNEFHVRELDRGELEALLRPHFPAFRLWGQKLLFASAIWSLADQPGVGFLQERDAGVTEASAPDHDPVYFLALCAADESALPEPPAGLSLFDDAPESVYAHYHHEIRKNMAAGGLLAEREAEIEALRRALSEAQTRASEPRSWWRRLLGLR